MTIRGGAALAALACVLVTDVAGQAPPQVPSISQRPNGASLGTIRIGAADDNIWFGWRVGVPSTAIAGLTFSAALARADALSVTSVEAVSTQITAAEVAEAARSTPPGRGAERDRASAAGVEPAGAGLSRR